MARRGGLFSRRTAKQRAASRRNLIKARRKKIRAHDTLTYWGKKGLTSMVSTATVGVGTKANTWMSGNYRQKPNKFYKSRSRKR